MYHDYGIFVGLSLSERYHIWKENYKQDIENASEKYYEDNIDAFFRSSTYCLLSIEEKRNIAQLKKVRDAIVDQAKEIKRQIDRKVVPKNSSI